MTTETTPFVLSCFECDAGDGIDSKEEAILQGWTDIDDDDSEDDTLWWTHLGRCPECMTYRELRDRRLFKRDTLREMRDAKREQVEHDRYEAQADEAHAVARETQEIDDEFDPDSET